MEPLFWAAGDAYTLVLWKKGALTPGCREHSLRENRT